MQAVGLVALRTAARKVHYGPQARLLPAAVLWQQSKLPAMRLLQACGPKTCHCRSSLVIRGLTFLQGCLT